MGWGGWGWSGQAGLTCTLHSWYLLDVPVQVRFPAPVTDVFLEGGPGCELRSGVAGCRPNPAPSPPPTAPQAQSLHGLL